MDALFLIDCDSLERELNSDECQAQRGDYAEEWLREIRTACLALARQALPKSMSQARRRRRRREKRRLHRSRRQDWGVYLEHVSWARWGRGRYGVGHGVRR